MKIDIIIAYIQRYQKGHEVDFVPPLTGNLPKDAEQLNLYKIALEESVQTKL
ncbi:MAG: hypothetical protein KDD02_11325 [Phaeodactylibacter sp.]|nr:hypothetical protein [Phaeodactylibacter sp.]MCB9302431.1 hypothetical protein [Lewinellaceae bacterium]